MLMRFDLILRVLCLGSTPLSIKSLWHILKIVHTLCSLTSGYRRNHQQIHTGRSGTVTHQRNRPIVAAERGDVVFHPL